MKTDASIEQRLAALESAHLRRRPRRLCSPQGRQICLDGKLYVNFSSNDTLGLAAHPTLRAAAGEALATHGHGAGAARLLSGDFDLAAELEEAVAAWLGAEAALLFSSGYHANLGVLSALAVAGDRLFSDADNHASIIDGCRLARAETTVYPHLEAPVSRLREGDLVVTESIFSMEGLPIAPGWVDGVQARGARAIVDEAHAFGWAGPSGRGLAPPTTFCRVGTFGKALGSYGAFAAGARSMIELLRSTARSSIFTTALPAPVLAASLAAVRLLTSAVGDEHRETLSRNCRRFAERMGSAVTGQGPIFAMPAGSAARAVRWSHTLEDRGLLVHAIRPPTVRAPILRIVVSSSHTADDIDALASNLLAPPNRVAD